MDSKEQHKHELIRTIIEKRYELKHKQKRLNYNIYAEVCQKSLLAKRKTIFELQLQAQQIEYELKHNL